MNTIPPGLLRFRGELQRAIAADLARTPPHRRARTGPPVPRLGLVGASCLAALAFALAVMLPGGGPDVIERAQAALQPEREAVLHLRVVVHLRGPRGTRPLMRVDTWQLTEPPFPARAVTVAPGGRVREAGYSPDGVFVYDRRRREVRRIRSEPTNPLQLRLEDPVQEIRDELGRGGARVTGRVRIGGKDAYRIRLSETTYLADAQTFRPLQVVGTIPTRDGRAGTVYIARFLVYRLLPASPQNRALTSVVRAHPHARTVD
jgi:hypothetical protein